VTQSGRIATHAGRGTRSRHGCGRL